MKTSIWDILSFLLIIGIVLFAAVVALIFINPNSPINPFPPQGGGIASLFIPSPTPTQRRLPPTWTPTSRPTDQPTATRRPTSTSQPTFTAFVLPSPTLIAKTVLPTNTRAPLEGKCKVVSQTPSDGTSIAPGSIFTSRWVLQNTSDTPWRSDGIDVRFRSGESMHTGKSVIDLPATVGVGDTFEVTIQMMAPETKGYHITYWAFMEGSTPRCSFYIEIFTE